jgi:penicillin-insensitive murein endopeptidase
MLRRALVVTAVLVAGSAPDAAAVEPATPAAVRADTPLASEQGRTVAHRRQERTAAAATPTRQRGEGGPSGVAPVGGGDGVRSADPMTWSSADLALELARDPSSVGSLSLGRPNAGALFNGVRMPDGPGWEVVDPGRSYATSETVAYLERAFAKLRTDFPDAPQVFVGHLSRERGGALGPHRSHQSGRDVDLGYIHLGKAHAWYQRASARNLDVERTWALIRALVTETDVEVMFIDLLVQKLLKEHALAIGEDPAWLDSLFRYQSHHPEPLIRQAWGHSTHVHVRFYNPRAQALGMRAYQALGDLGHIAPRSRVVRYVARPGDTVEQVAKRAGTSKETLQKYNRGDVTALEAGKIYLVPVRGQVAEVKTLEIPPRRLPPAAAHAVATAPTLAGSTLGRRASPRR